MLWSFVHRLLLGLVLFVPMWAGHQALLVARGGRARLEHWIGLTIAGQLAMVFPIAGLALASQGARVWLPHGWVGLLALAAPVLAAFMARAHARRLREPTEVFPGTAVACLAFAVGHSLALVPWILGAPMPPAWLGLAWGPVGHLGDYLSVVLPVAGVLSVEASVLAGRTSGFGFRRAQRRVTATGIALVGVISMATLALPRSRFDARFQAKREREAFLAQAERLDRPRRQALAAIANGQTLPALAGPCEVPLSAEWQQLGALGSSPGDRRTMAEQAAAWRRLSSIDLWRPEQPEGPRMRAIRTATDEATWRGPWPEKDVFVGPDEARRRVRRRIAPALFDLDASLVVSRELPALSVGGSTELGKLDGALWLWSYRDQRFVCAAEIHLPRAGMPDGITDRDAEAARDALRMQSVALAVRSLRAVARQP